MSSERCLLQKYEMAGSNKSGQETNPLGGTVGSQEEAARLYDRAAFMCGREPNFELSEEEKQELRQFKWDEFLAFTRHSITHKRSHKRSESPLEENGDWNGDWDSKRGIGGFLASEEVRPDSSAF